jgi:branched-subunit amino acid ABC-type transport system permease component
MNLVPAAFGYGIIDAAVLSLAAVGMTMQFSITNIFNLAVGSQMMIGAMTAWSLNRAGLGVWYCLTIAGLGGGVIAWALNRLLYAPFLRRKGTTFFGVVIISMGMLLVMQFGAQAIWGPNNFSYSMSSASYHWGTFSFTSADIVIVGIAVVAMLAIHGLLTRTKLGKAMRAVSADRDLAASSGIPVGLVSDVVWLITGILAAIGGVALAMNLQTFNTNLGATYLLIIVAAIVLGGVGRIYGAIVGALIVAVAAQEATLVIPSAYDLLTPFVILVLILFIRPTGLFSGTAIRKGVVVK